MTQIIEAYVEIREELTKNVFSKIISIEYEMSEKDEHSPGHMNQGNIWGVVQAPSHETFHLAAQLRPNSFESFKFGGGGRPTYSTAVQVLSNFYPFYLDSVMSHWLRPWPASQPSRIPTRPTSPHPCPPSPSSAGTPQFLHPSCDEGFGPAGGLELRLIQLKQDLSQVGGDSSIVAILPFLFNGFEVRFNTFEGKALGTNEDQVMLTTTSSVNIYERKRRETDLGLNRGCKEGESDRLVTRGGEASKPWKQAGSKYILEPQVKR
ncbi:hypothetical protein C8J57DRAFT_1250289 [Mycena rebaudengoi]|nr:hypothetical protein C8J57DRAFT_1250289 [Mycena rebaudengoi]